MPKSGEETGQNLQKQQQSWPKISNTARKYNKDENLENYDSEVQMHARAHSDEIKRVAYERCNCIWFPVDTQQNTMFRWFGHLSQESVVCLESS